MLFVNVGQVKLLSSDVYLRVNLTSDVRKINTGVGKSKKHAKRTAAENLLKLIKNNTDVESLSSLHSSSNSDDINSQVTFSWLKKLADKKIG